MSQHTPGPWRIARDTYGVERIWGPDAESIACAEGDGFIGGEEREANARLITAAPALLAACKAAVAAFDLADKEARPLAQNWADLRAAAETARAAIDQAEAKS